MIGLLRSATIVSVTALLSWGVHDWVDEPRPVAYGDWVTITCDWGALTNARVADTGTPYVDLTLDRFDETPEERWGEVVLSYCQVSDMEDGE